MTSNVEKSFAAQTRWVRWFVGIVVACLPIFALLVDDTVLQSCGQQVVNGEGGAQRIERVCSAPGATDIQTLALVFIVGLLVLPDFSEIGFGQVLTLKRTVQQQASKQSELQTAVGQQESKQRTLETRIENVSQMVHVVATTHSSSAANATPIINIGMNAGSASLQEAYDGLVETAANMGERIDGIEKMLLGLNTWSGLTNRGRVAIDWSKVPTAEPTSATSGRILWVDDKPANNVVERKALTDRNHTVVTARTTSDALRLFDEQQFDAVITDLGRTEGASGYIGDAGVQLIEKLRARETEVPLLVYSRVARRGVADERLSRLTALNAKVTTSVVQDVETALGGNANLGQNGSSEDGGSRE